MKIRSVEISNYRCFEKLKVEFDPAYNLHVIIAPNMVGKSALIKALRIVISSYLRKINGGNIEINLDEFRVIGTNPFSDVTRGCSIHIELELLIWNLKWQDALVSGYIFRTANSKTLYQSSGIYNDFSIKGAFNGANYDSGHQLKDFDLPSFPIEAIDALSSKSYDRVIENKESFIPLLLYIGSEYLHQLPARNETLKFDGSTIQGYWHCLKEEDKESYVFEWLQLMNEIFEEQQRKSNAAILYQDLPETFLVSFENVMKEMFPEEIVSVQWIKNPLYSKTKARVKDTKLEDILTFNFKNNEVRTYDMLSDGYKYLVLLAGEMVVRCILLNKHLKYDAVKKTNGVVLIDEFGIHLHPDLQNAALKRLSEIFPKIQFIISTHSPLLLNGLLKEQVHILEKDDAGNRVIHNADEDIIGLGAEGILLDIFGLVSTYDDTSLKWANDYKNLLLKKTNEGLTTEELNTFRDLSKKLASITLDPSLDIKRVEDPLYVRFKERLKLYEEKEKNKIRELSDMDIDKLLEELLTNQA